MPPTNTLGPQCLLCKKRRVKCDSTMPSCRKCQRAHRHCPGYVAPRKWVAFEPTKSSQATLQASSSSPVPVPTLNSPSDDDTSPHSSHSSSSLTSSSTVPELFDLDTSRRDWHIKDAIDYFNSIVIRDLVPYPFARSSIVAWDAWKKAPSVLQNIMLVVVCNHKIICNKGDEGATTDLYKYRGDSMRELAQSLEASSEPLVSIRLISVLLVLQAEIQISAVAHWEVHLRAARRFTAELGGLRTCLQKWPQFQMLFALHTLVEVMSPITSPASLLTHEELQDACENVLLLPGIEKKLLASSCPLPLPLLAVVTRINRLRRDLYDGSPKPGGPMQGLIAAFESALQQLDRFDASEWAARVIEEFPGNDCCNERSRARSRESELSEWTVLGQCYQSATTIYLLRSITSSSQQDRAQIIPGATTTIPPRLEEELYALGTNLNELMLYFSDDDPSPLRPGLWRFAMLPLFLHAFELLVWQRPIAATNVKEHHLNRLRAHGRALGTRTTDAAVDCIEQAILLRRRQGGVLHWDECFPDRSIFVF